MPNSGTLTRNRAVPAIFPSAMSAVARPSASALSARNVDYVFDARFVTVTFVGESDSNRTMRPAPEPPEESCTSTTRAAVKRVWMVSDSPPPETIRNGGGLFPGPVPSLPQAARIASAATNGRRGVCQDKLVIMMGAGRGRRPETG